jgi:RNA polymerase sigma-70 factor (ECF subfamily)
VGAERVARALLALGRAGMAGARMEHVDVNGLPGLYAQLTDGTAGVAGFTLDGGRIIAIDIVRNPAKLRV